ncbi:ATP-dependent helicase [Thermosynechococcus sp. PP45]|uniref:ATP-dependent helicase n=1 Tax=unclassified Thermosynechococcus TaxID=2622553 RepID=UPI0026711285|nr:MULTISPECIES: ATP-dependent helicase [unclassified Thermosynechococcus]WKT81331.1 ATP-dependent helicase [Thermosynechococcus sp. PP45]WNC24943.1 ATP-dependent helicase [Thermosynechococcus sp. PP551]WNC27520.1 ATP-dependent helicase [Thermosynechococcus sp. PP555]
MNVLSLPANASHLLRTLRPGQREISEWQGGLLAVSAVPGAGKSHGMAVGAAIAIAREKLHQQRQLVVVTYSRSAAANIKVRIRQYLREMGLPRNGFSVQTLHSLALKIATSHPTAGLRWSGENLMSEHEQRRLCVTCVKEWARSHPDILEQLIQGCDTSPLSDVEHDGRRSALLTDILVKLAQTVISSARSMALTPHDLRQLSQQLRSQSAAAAEPYPFLEIGADLLELYQHHLAQREQIDYDEMILAAVQLLEGDRQCRQEWQQRVYAVFEDEAQDSTPLQLRLLRLLAEDNTTGQVNFVRVGDPNQAINSTFTAADPLFFNKFCDECAQQQAFYKMTQAGRSTPLVIRSANFLVNWVNHALKGQELPFRSQAIQPVSPTDPQPGANPPPWGEGVEIARPATVFETVRELAARISEVLAEYPEASIAVLVRTNRQGEFVADLLRSPASFSINTDLAAQGIPILDVSGIERRSQVPKELLDILYFLHCPYSPEAVKAALTVLQERKRISVQNLDRLAAQPEVFLYPGPLDPPAEEPVLKARHYCQRLLKARLELSLFPLITYCAQELGYDAAELATSDRLICHLAQQEPTQLWERIHPRWQELVATDRFDAVEMEDLHSRLVRSGQVTIMTMHRAKGLDWDAVFVPFLEARTLPGESWVAANAKFLSPEVDFTDVVRSQLRAYGHQQPLPDWQTAYQKATEAKVAEEYRLLYVAMTRAKRLLWLAAAHQAPFNWQTFDWRGFYQLQDSDPCPFLPALEQKLKKHAKATRGDR